MELDALAVFIEVVRRGSFAAVARERGVAPSSISRTLAGLEDELGLRLLQRTTRRLSPTEAGAVYLERIEPLVEGLVQAHHQAADLDEQPSGVLRVTAPVSFAQETLVPWLPALLERHPRLHVELHLTDAMVDLVAERIDVAVRLGRLPDSELVARRVATFDFVICAAPAYLERRGRPRRPQDLARHETVLFLMGGVRSRWRLRKQGRTVTVHVRGRCTLGSSMAVRRAAIDGLGLALLPRFMVADALAEGTLVALLPSWEATATDFAPGVWVLLPSRRYVPLKVRAFVAFVQERLGGRC